MPKDMTERQFWAACKRHGFKSLGFMGYFDLGNGSNVSVQNAVRSTWRGWLAYLLEQKELTDARLAKRLEEAKSGA